MKHHIVIICGSVREGSRTLFACQLLQDELEKHAATVDLIRPHSIPLAYLGAPFPEPFSSELKQRVSAAQGLILCTPEYNGSFSAVMMAVIENLGYPVVFAGKPVSLLGVAGGRIGAVKALEHLRSVCSHSGALVLPGSISVADSHENFDAAGHCLKAQTEKQIRGVALGLVQFLQGRTF